MTRNIPTDYAEILPGKLFLGSCNFTDDQLNGIDIDVVINVTPACEIPATVVSLPTLRYPMSYLIPTNETFNNTRMAIRDITMMIRAGKKVYVHGHYGINRSAVVAIGVVSNIYCYTVSDALTHVSSKRCIAPHPYFLEAL